MSPFIANHVGRDPYEHGQHGGNRLANSTGIMQALQSIQSAMERLDKAKVQ